MKQLKIIYCVILFKKLSIIMNWSEKKYNKDLKEIQKTKEDIIKTIFKLKTKREDIMLNVDKIMFDNNVMTECVLRNFNDLKKIC